MINLLEKYHCQIPIIQVVSVMEKTALKFRVGNLLVVIVAPSKKKKKNKKNDWTCGFVLPLNSPVTLVEISFQLKYHFLTFKNI
jgi:hypothetical protein